MTVAKRVVDIVIGYEFITVDRDYKTDVNTVLCSLQRLLSIITYKKGMKKGMKNYRVRAEKLLKRDWYVQFITVQNQDSARRVVYMDVCYTQDNYQRHDDFLLTQITRRITRLRPFIKEGDMVLSLQPLTRINLLQVFVIRKVQQ